MNAYATYSPSENDRYLKEHGASPTTQSYANASSLTASASAFTPSNGALNVAANSQQSVNGLAMDAIDEPADVGVPTADQSRLPLKFAELMSLEEDDVLYILDLDENQWTRYLFVCFEEEGFTVKQVLSPILFPKHNPFSIHFMSSDYE